VWCERLGVAVSLAIAPEFDLVLGAVQRMLRQLDVPQTAIFEVLGDKT
jgi:hypothetical protein